MCKPMCVQCDATEKKLKRMGVDYEKIDLTQDDAAMSRMKELGYMQAPVVFAPNGEHWSGFNPDKLEALAV